MSAINETICQIREVAYLQPSVPCDRCHHPAEHFSTAQRMAIDLELEQPVLLSVTVSVHHCPACQHYFRVQPPFLRPDATYSQRVVRKAIEAVYQDGMAMRRVPDRLARDFWVSPSEGMVRLWCKAYQGAFDFETDYQRWVISEFSGILCVDEVYQDRLALLLAVDPAAVDGDRLVGYQLVHGPVDGAIVDAFLTRLREAGVDPEQIITDGSSLYPTVLANVWPAAAHQLCLFHETRHVTKVAMEIIQAARSALPNPPPKIGSGALQGRLPNQPPTDNPEDPAHQRWQLRQAIRQAGVAQVHALARQGFSLRSIARQLGIHRRTVRGWLQREPPVEVPADLAENWHRQTLPNVDAIRRTARQAKREQVRRLAQQGLNYSAIARQVGLCRVTVKRWLLVSPPPDPPLEATEQLPADTSPHAEEARDHQLSPATKHPPQDAPNTKGYLPDPPPPVPWTSWEQVGQVREALREHRFLLLRRPEHLNADQDVQVAFLVHSPLSQLLVARSFLLDWYRLWSDEQGRRRTLDEARSRYETWRSNPLYRTEPPLRRLLDQMTNERFERLSPFLRNLRWEATNNAAERTGRAFRHAQAPHFNLRSEQSIGGALIVATCQRKQAALNALMKQANRATRGRRRPAVVPT